MESKKVYSQKQKQRLEGWLPGPRGGGDEERLVKGYELPVIRGISSGDLMYLMVTVVKNTVLLGLPWWHSG